MSCCRQSLPGEEVSTELPGNHRKLLKASCCLILIQVQHSPELPRSCFSYSLHHNKRQWAVLHLQLHQHDGWTLCSHLLFSHLGPCQSFSRRKDNVFYLAKQHQITCIGSCFRASSSADGECYHGFIEFWGTAVYKPPDIWLPHHGNHQIPRKPFQLYRQVLYNDGLENDKLDMLRTG